MKPLIVALSLLMLGGCASNGQVPWAGLLAPGSCPKPSSDQELSLNLADDMANEGKLHASLANLQNLPSALPQVRQRQARAYRLLGRPDAEPLYRSLLALAWPPTVSTAWGNWHRPRATTARPWPTCNARQGWRPPTKKSAMTWAWSTSTNGAWKTHALNS